MNRLSDGIAEKYILYYIVIEAEGKSRSKLVFLYDGMMIRRYQALLIAAYFINYSQEVIRKIKHSFGRVFDDDQSTILQAILSKKL